MSEKINTITRRFHALLAVALLGLAGSATAATVTVENGTLTEYNVLTNDLSFDYDLNSVWDLSPTVPGVSDFSIITPSGPLATIYEFILPNFYDPLPMKTIEVTMLGNNSGASGLDLPTVLSVIGADSDYYTGGPAVLFPGEFVDGTTSSTKVTENWVLYPNPDSEVIKIFAPIGFELETIIIETQSTVVPVPAAAWLFASGLLGLVGVARKKR
jgi:hypothetical protein